MTTFRSAHIATATACGCAQRWSIRSQHLSAVALTCSAALRAQLVRRQLGPGFVQEMQIECDRCGGTGRIVKHHCPVCGGGKVVPGEEELEIIVERGMPDGHAIVSARPVRLPGQRRDRARARVQVFEHKADARADKAPGHLIFAVHTVPHDLFAREGNNLRAPLRISLLEASCCAAHPACLFAAA